MRAAAAASPGLRVAPVPVPVPVPVGAPEHLAGRKPQYAGAAASAEEDGGSPSPGPDGLKCPLRRFTWSRSPAARSNMDDDATRRRRRPLVRAASEDSDWTSGGCGPLPGDTLPWNLQKHQRMKRSRSASGDVLDPAERAVIRIAGEALRRRRPGGFRSAPVGAGGPKWVPVRGILQVQVLSLVAARTFSEGQSSSQASDDPSADPGETRERLKHAGRVQDPLWAPLG
ncbi:uncharacterized protein LOC103460342 [Poecilia reticulata]|uniref:uncharacterized protein LOC103460342 n=1 Tax=Poecilia reticulata TaxID=8081 RepID=UPI0004A2D82D|nr:PREDICTED: uncharacterized protein LOC103460342 [Poecilia reticulata]